MSQDGSWRRSTWTPPKPFKSSVISKQAGRWESTGAPFNSPTRRAKLPDWHLRRLSRRQLSQLIVFLPLNPEEFTTLGESAQSYNPLPPRLPFRAECLFLLLRHLVRVRLRTWVLFH